MKRRKRSGLPAFLLVTIVSILLMVAAIWALLRIADGQWGSQTLTTEQAAGRTEAEEGGQVPAPADYTELLKDIPDFQGDPYVEINDNKPFFTEADLTTETFESYSDLDSLGRCGTVMANVCPETMPDTSRGPIGEIHPSGWQLANYHDLIDGNYLYNRCHLIAFSLTGENANEKNLITGTRYLNTIGMQPFELMVLDYVRATGNHVLYRVTPVFEGDNLLASGVFMEAMSVEDKGQAISYNIYAYNVQPGILIDYKTGDNSLDLNYSDSSEEETTTEKDDPGSAGEKSNPDSGGGDSGSGESRTAASDEEDYYVLNTNTHKFHLPSCDSVRDMKEKNKAVSHDSREDIIGQGYEPCSNCKP